MKKQVKGIIGLGAVLVLLGGGYAALKLTDPDKNGGGDDSSSSTVSSLEQEKEGAGTILISDNGEEATVAEAYVKNETDEFHVVMLTEPTEDSGATYTFDGYQDIKMNTAVIGKYGLDKPKITVDFTYESGTKRTLYIGNDAPSGSGAYVMTDEGSSIYTAKTSSLANYSKTLNDFVDTTVLEEPSDDDYPIINSLRIERQDIDYDILLEYDKASDDDSYKGGTSATHVMVEPVDCYLTVERSTDITNGMFGLSAEGFYALSTTRSARSQWLVMTATPMCSFSARYSLMTAESTATVCLRAEMLSTFSHPKRHAG